MLIEGLLRRLGNQAAVENARVASTDLSRRRVEREAVHLYLQRLEERRAHAAATAAPVDLVRAALAAEPAPEMAGQSRACTL
jgi:hypothetical protein